MTGWRRTRQRINLLVGLSLVGLPCACAARSGGGGRSTVRCEDRRGKSKKKRPAGFSPAGLIRKPNGPSLDGLEVRGLGAARVRHDVEGDLLAFRQRAHASGFNGGGVHEHVLAAAFRRDKAKALGGIEKLHGS